VAGEHPGGIAFNIAMFATVPILELAIFGFHCIRYANATPPLPGLSTWGDDRIGRAAIRHPSTPMGAPWSEGLLAIRWKASWMHCPIALLESWEPNEYPVLRVANCESPRAAIAVARGALTTTKK
jgi:hypothetical protein